MASDTLTTQPIWLSLPRQESTKWRSIDCMILHEDGANFRKIGNHENLNSYLAQVKQIPWHRNNWITPALNHHKLISCRVACNTNTTALPITGFFQHCVTFYLANSNKKTTSRPILSFRQHLMTRIWYTIPQLIPHHCQLLAFASTE